MKPPLFTHVGIHSSSDPLNDIPTSTSLFCGSSTGSLGFGACLGFLGRFLALTPSACNFLHSAFYSRTASMCSCTISFHSSSITAFAVFQSTCATHVCSNSSAFFSLFSFWSQTSAIHPPLAKCLPKPSAKSIVQSLFFLFYSCAEPD